MSGVTQEVVVGNNTIKSSTSRTGNGWRFSLRSVCRGDEDSQQHQGASQQTPPRQAQWTGACSTSSTACTLQRNRAFHRPRYPLPDTFDVCVFTSEVQLSTTAQIPQLALNVLSVAHVAQPATDSGTSNFTPRVRAWSCTGGLWEFITCLHGRRRLHESTRQSAQQGFTLRHKSDGDTTTKRAQKEALCTVLLCS